MIPEASAFTISNALPPRLILVRHAAVDERYLGICYGRSDVALGHSGEQQSCQLADKMMQDMSQGRCDRIMHSGLQRTRFLAECLGERLACPTVACAALQERDFGTWELQPWDTIHARDGADMLRMVSEPATFRPGGGETTFDMRDRVLRWFDSLPREGLTIVVTHGGPIAALLGTQQQLPVSQWPALIPRCGELVPIPLPPVLQG